MDIKKIREAIAHASTLEEVERLTRLLQSGHVPGQEGNRKKPSKRGNMIYLSYSFRFVKNQVS